MAATAAPLYAPKAAGAEIVLESRLRLLAAATTASATLGKDLAFGAIGSGLVTARTCAETLPGFSPPESLPWPDRFGDNTHSPAGPAGNCSRKRLAQASTWIHAIYRHERSGGIAGPEATERSATPRHVQSPRRRPDLGATCRQRRIAEVEPTASPTTVPCLKPTSPSTLEGKRKRPSSALKKASSTGPACATPRVISPGSRKVRLNHCRPIGAMPQGCGALGETKVACGSRRDHSRPKPIRSLPSAP